MNSLLCPVPGGTGPAQVVTRQGAVWFGALVLAWFGWGAALRAEEVAPEQAVVQILTYSQVPEFDSPWRFEAVQHSAGTGFVIAGGRIMTNAHVIAWAKQILVRRYQDPRLLPARVVFAGHDCDLAVLELEDPAQLAGVPPLSFGELPPVQSTVVTCGYPAGGDQMSFTRGVVSRIEVQPYAHAGNRALLAVQTDAAINPGNSGGPVFQGDKVIGVAFQGIPGLQNAGFFIPPEVVGHFLKDIADGHYDGFPQVGVTLEPLQNAAYRRVLGLGDDGRGARVDALRAGGPAAQVLQADDVLLEAGGYPVGSDGMISYQGNRVAVGVAFQQPQAGEALKLSVLREGRTFEVEVKMEAYDGDRLAGRQYEQPPRYVIHAGLVFTPLSADYLESSRARSRDFLSEPLAELTYQLYHLAAEAPEAVRPETVVLSGILPHAVNADFAVRGLAVVNRINGVRIERLEDVRRALLDNKGERHLFEFNRPDHAVLDALDRAAASAAHTEILRTYGIVSDQRL